MTNAHEILSKYGQSIWLDYFDPSLWEYGALNMLILDGVRGVIGNPTLYAKAIASNGWYDDTIREFIQADQAIGSDLLYLWLVTKDARTAADSLRSVHDSSGGQDGFVSVDLPAGMPDESAELIDAARRVWKRIDRKNLMIKIPATDQGIRAMEALVAEGININSTYLFSGQDYRKVAEAYLRGLASNPDPSRVFSVASFFLSCFDARINRELDRLGITELQVVKNKAAVSQARIAYQHYKEIAASDEFGAQRKRHANMQRLLWADTTPAPGSEQPLTFYVEQLIGRETVAALTPETFDELLLSGQLIHSLDSDIASAWRIDQVMESLDIRAAAIIPQLREECLQKLEDAHYDVLKALDQKRLQLAKEYA